MARVEFREGFREVPDHVAELLKGYDTYQLTYEEALRKANWRLAADAANREQQRLIAQSLRRR